MTVMSETLNMLVNNMDCPEIVSATYPIYSDDNDDGFCALRLFPTLFPALLCASNSDDANNYSSNDSSSPSSSSSPSEFTDSSTDSELETAPKLNRLESIENIGSAHFSPQEERVVTKCLNLPTRNHVSSFLEENGLGNSRLYTFALHLHAHREEALKLSSKNRDLMWRVYSTDRQTFINTIRPVLYSNGFRRTSFYALLKQIRRADQNVANQRTSRRRRRHGGSSSE